ncbi:MAG: hypothetical protein QM610_11115 [Chitinophagaceae bacterium]
MVFCIPFWLYAQHTVNLAPNARYTKTSDIEATTKMSVYGQEYTYSVIASLKTDYEVVAKYDTGYKIKITLDAVNSQLTSNGVTMSFNSQQDTLRDMDTIFAKPLSDILGETDLVRIDSLGNILASDTSELHRKANEYITSTLLLGNDYSVGKRLDMVFHFRDSVAVGATWIDSFRSGDDGMRIDTFTITKIYNHIVYVSVKGHLSRSLPVQQGGNVTIAHFVGDTEAALQVAEDSGVINNRLMKTHIQSRVKVNNTEIPIVSDIQLKEVVR